MTCKELCRLLVEQKNSAHVCLKDSLQYMLQLSPKKIEAIECGFGSFNVNDLIAYIKMCDASLSLTGWEEWDIDTVDDLREYLSRERELSSVTIRQLARSIKVPILVIEAFEKRDGGLRIDSFLDIIDTLKIELKIH